VPDVTRPAVYALSAKEVVAYRTVPTLDTLGRAPVRYGGGVAAKGHAGDLRALFDMSTRRRQGVFDAPVATTVDGTLHIYFRDARKPVVQAATFPAFAGADVAVAGPGGTASPVGAAAPEEYDRPIDVPVGKPFTRQVAVPPGATATLVSGPAGMTLSAGGTLSWTPTAAVAGTTQSVKVRLDRTDGGGPTFVRYALAVAGPPSGTTPAPSVGATATGRPGHRRGASPPEQAVVAVDPRAITLPYDFMGRTIGYAFAPSYDGQHLLVLTGRTLRLTDGSGALAVETHELPRRYTRLAERDAYYIAASTTTLDLLDKRTLAVIRSIKLHTAETYDLAIHPTLRMSYVALHDESLPTDSTVRSRRVVTVNETTGTVTLVPGVFGQWVAADPRGRRLFVGAHDLYQNGYELDFNFDDFIRPAYGDIDLLGVLPLVDGAPQRGKATTTPGVNGQAVRVSPDGDAVCFVSAAGRPVYSYAVPALDPANLNETLATYSAKAGGGLFPQDLCFHPTLPIVAMACPDRVLLFDRATGDLLDDKLGPLPGVGNRNLDRVLFSPDGKSVVIDPVTDGGPIPPPGHGDKPKDVRRVFAVPLKLSDAELAQLARAKRSMPRSAPAPDAPPAEVVPRDDRADQLAPRT
jgi:hypothetical protein